MELVVFLKECHLLPYPCLFTLGTRLLLKLRKHYAKSWQSQNDLCSFLVCDSRLDIVTYM